MRISDWSSDVCSSDLILELPYLYEDLDHMQRVAEAIAPDVQAIFEKGNVKNLGFLFLGPRSIAGREPIRNLADMEGLRLRVPELPLYVGMTRALGAVPTPVPFAEAYTRDRKSTRLNSSH